MIREWMYPNGTVAQFDTVTKFIQFLDPGSRENVVAPHKATDDEVLEYKKAYPDATQEEILKKQAVTSTLYTALVEMRQITSDSQVSGQELQAALPAVTRAMESYRDYDGPRDDTIDKLVNLLLSQSVLALQILVSSAYAGIYNTVVQGQVIKTNLELLEEKVDQHIASLHP